MRVVLAADMHLGYSIRLEQMKQMVKKINACHPDLVIFAGDIFANSYDAIEHPEKIEEVRFAGMERKQQLLYDAQVLKMTKELEKRNGTESDRCRYCHTL